jgi:LCP family protein required for cell wall assembly
MTKLRTMRTFLLLAVAMSLMVQCRGAPAPTSAAEAPHTPAPPTATATASRTATATPTASMTPVRASATPVPTRTGTATPLPTPTYTATATSTPTARATATRSAPSAEPGQVISPTLTPTITPTPAFSPTPLPTAVGSGSWLNILLIGLDSTTNLGSQNTDVIIVASINRQTQQVSMLSIPRDLWVYIPTYGWSRINTAHKRGVLAKYPGEGPGLLMRTIEVNLGIPVEQWARIDFKGFEKVVDELGGIDITVACPVNLEYRPGDSGGDQILQPGTYHMDGATALRYVRTRRGGSDFDRARRQHQFLKAMWDQRRSIGVGQIPGLFSALSKSIKTDLGLGDILSLAPVALDLQPQRIRSRYIGANQTTDWTTADGWQVLLPRYDKIQETVAGLYAGPSGSEDKAAVEGARIRVLNGTPQAQSGQIAADELRWHGLNVVEVGAADRSDYAKTKIIAYSDKPEALGVLAQVFHVKPADIVRQPDASQPVDIQVLLGGDYDPCP